MQHMPVEIWKYDISYHDHVYVNRSKHDLNIECAQKVSTL